MKRLLETVSDQIINRTPYRQVPNNNPLDKKQCGNNFCSNDYLGLAKHKATKKSSILAIKKYGCGSTGSRLMSGGIDYYFEAEEKIANFFGYDAALLFGSGFLANIGVFGALLCARDVVFFDRYCHASIVDGIAHSGARWKRFLHNNLEHLEKMLSSNVLNHGGNCFIVTESVFSMDGDLADLRAISDIAKKYNAILVVDEAHSIGIFGNGKGLSFQCNTKPDIIITPFGKAFGSHGAACLCDKKTKRALIQSSRPFIFSTALPPASVFAVSTAIDILSKNINYGNRLIELAKFFYSKLLNRFISNKKVFDIKFDSDGTMTAHFLPKPHCTIRIPKNHSHIVPIIFKDERTAEEIARRLAKKNLLVRAIKHPTVPKGTERIRISVCLFHSKKCLNQLAKAIEQEVIATSESMACS